MQQAKIRILVSVAGVNPDTGDDFKYGKGSEVWITPKLALSFINSGQGILLEGFLKEGISREVKPVAKLVNKPKKHPLIRKGKPKKK